MRGTRLAIRSGPDGNFTLGAVPAGQQALRVSADGYFTAEQSLAVATGTNLPTHVVLAGDKPLRGEVIWRGGFGLALAVPGAAVNVKGTDVTASADGDGRFAVAGLPPAPLGLVVKAPGFRSKEVDCDPRTDVDLPVVLSGDAAASGRVVDAAFEPPRPVAGATVRVDQSPLVVQSGADGQFALNGARSGTARIVATAPGYLPRESPAILPPETSTPLGDIPLAGDSEVQGTVVRQGSRTPIAGAEVRIPGTKLSAKSDSAGRFRFGGLTPGTIELGAAAAGYLPGRRTEELASGRNSLQIELKDEVIAAKPAPSRKSPPK